MNKTWWIHCCELTVNNSSKFESKQKDIRKSLKDKDQFKNLNSLISHLTPNI